MCFFLYRVLNAEEEMETSDLEYRPTSCDVHCLSDMLKIIKLQFRVASIQKLTRQQRKSTKRCTKELYQLWTEYARSLLDLEAGSRLVCPNIDVV